jgi:hypothetical protein
LFMEAGGVGREEFSVVRRRRINTEETERAVHSEKREAQKSRDVENQCTSRTGRREGLTGPQP